MLEQKFMLPRLTLAAARFMTEQELLIRNTHTAQVSSLHYDGGHCPDAHGSNGGIFSVPLWTIAIPDILQKPRKPKVDAYCNEQQEQQHANGFVEPLSASLLAKSPEEQHQHLEQFLNAMKSFIQPFTAFGYRNDSLLNYELLVIQGGRAYIDNYDVYPTGGRTRCAVDSNSIVYRIVFNSMERQLFKDILDRHYDEKIYGNGKTPDSLVAVSARIILCNQLAVEIIAAKLVYFLNSLGKAKSIISLSKEQLNSLLMYSLDIGRDEINTIMKENLVHIYAKDTLKCDKEYPVSAQALRTTSVNPLVLNWHNTSVYIRFPNHHAELDQARKIYFDLSALLCTQQPQYIRTQAVWMLDNINFLCSAEPFNTELMARINISYMRFNAKRTEQLKIEQFENEFTKLLDNLKQETNRLICKGNKTNPEYNPRYAKVAERASELIQRLEVASNKFFENPVSLRYKGFIAQCTQAIEQVETEFNTHHGLRHSIHPLLRGIIGFLSILALGIPALLIERNSTNGFFKTIVGDYAPNAAASLQEFKTQVLAMS